MPRAHSIVSVATVASSFVLGACSGGGGNTGPNDAGSGSDTGLQETPDAATPDSGPPPRDAGIDSGADAGMEAGASSCPPATATGSMAVTYQIDPAHTGGQPGDTIVTPLCRRWSHDLGGPVSYALVAKGRVFVTFANGGAQLIALDEKTGDTVWGPTRLGGSYAWSGAAYDNGRVFAVNTSGTLSAFDEATGATAWSTPLPIQYSFSSPPTALGGFVYVGGAGSGGTVYAVNEATGAVVWQTAVENGDDSSPAVANGGVYVSYACNQAYDLDVADGGVVWHYSGPCEGGGGKTVVVYQSEVYTRDVSQGDLVLNAADGGLVRTYSAGYIPAFNGDTGYFVASSGALSAVGLGSATPSWTFDAGSPSVAAPIVAGSLVFTATSSALYALSIADGTTVSSVPLAGVRSPDEQNVSGPLAGFTAADGMLFVPAGNGIAAY